ncbi:creatininase family protein [Hydrogenothermus marinus]|uniref:Creatinine amidohydrolase n=1 Tax=Hydrogenothermus marinus TaxID=133270 RepID=A0A3M0B7Q5_9AQUI|nr:creatininase family protein [Hydrogenothermus marinus]RMA93137.1 creatinine amidohydrolase [Hydrogenothermus marinus]
MLLENMSYVEVQAYLQEKDIILIPIGSVEQHSPYGLIGTDFITAEAVAREVGKRIEVVVAPTLPYGMSQHHMAFSGTATLSPITYINLIKEIVSSFLEHGFRKIIFINGHGGNINPVKTAFDQLKYENKEGIYAIISWFLLKEVQDLVYDLFGDKEGHHATPSEISITKYLRPEAFKIKPKLEKDIEKPNTYWPLNRYEFKNIYPDGRMESASWLAKEKYGKIILEEAVRTTIEEIKKILEKGVNNE